jgi:hypothetical protein
MCSGDVPIAGFLAAGGVGRLACIYALAADVRHTGAGLASARISGYPLTLDKGNRA